MSDTLSTKAVADKILIALDVDSPEKAREIVHSLDGVVSGFKIGLQLFSNAGPELVREFTEKGSRIFLDLKFHDIPNTIARAAEQMVELGVWMFNVHAAGGREMMSATAEAVAAKAAAIGRPAPLVIGVTVLTSSDAEVLTSTGVPGTVGDQVRRLSVLAAESGLDGVVASANEAPLIKSAVGRDGFLTVTPGIRSTRGTLHDQKRVTTVSRAVAMGSDYLVIGRPVTEAKDRRAALDSILSE